ncbi:hypothetical protein ACFQJD_08665 [Haloplanus sp. GCM10025708]|uniref:hypothetical protein n=1 Tax=Haloferacaceae TaxID=1644056 RepID=UPI00361FFE59
MTDLTRGRTLLLAVGAVAVAVLGAFGYLVGVAISRQAASFDLYGVPISTAPLSMAGFGVGLAVVVLGGLFVAAEVASGVDAE